MSFLKNKEICYILLGHEINQLNFQLSHTSKERCKVLAEDIERSSNSNYFVLFMGLGRLQGECKLSISECMFEYFKNEFFIPEHYIIDKNSVDTVGDIIFSVQFLKKIKYKNLIKLATSDWHYKRCDFIINKIYKSLNNFSFLLTSELEDLKNEDKNLIIEKEKESILAFKRSFKYYDSTTTEPYLYLRDNHDFYKHINL
tara:strand:+ start:74 stop:673 length:600 start_codon:yes stop_codon:yes gene_type:complete